MKQFFGRLSDLCDHMIDTESLMPNKGRLKPIQIKTIFDNLRYYPLLAFLWFGVRLLQEDGSGTATVGWIVLFGVFAVLAILVVAQTWLVVLATVVTVVGGLLPSRWRATFRRRVRTRPVWLNVVGGIVTALLVLASYGVGAGLFRALSRAGLL